MYGFLDPRNKTVVHFVQLALVVVTLIVAGVRLATKSTSASRTRSDSMALGMGVKSLVVIAYQLLTEHVRRLHRYASLKANTVLNCLEIVFWAAVAFMGIQASVQYCIGTTCAMGWAVVVLGIILSTVASYASTLSYLGYQRGKAMGKGDRERDALSLR